MNPRNDEPTGALNWLRDDIGAIREHMIESSNRISSLTTSVDSIGATVRAHCADPNAHGSRLNSIAPGRNGRVPGWLIKVAPLLLAAALGLIGVGAYLGSGGDSDDTTRAIRAVSDATSRLARDMAELRAAVDGGD